MAEVFVADRGALVAALKTAADGDVIRLAAGDYGDLTLKNMSFTGNVTVTSADPAGTAQFDGLHLTSVSGLTFTNLEIQVAPGEKGVVVTGSTNVVLDDLDIHGVIGGGAVGEGSGLSVRDSAHVRISNCDFHDLTQGLSQLDNSNLLITYNTFSEIRFDGIRGGGSSYVDVIGNFFTNFARVGEEHPDAIQFWTTNTETVAHHINIAGNIYVRGEGTYAQGIFLKDETRKLPYEDVTIHQNAVIGGSYNGIAITGGNGAEISDNLVAGYPEMRSWIRVENARNIVLDDNSVGSFLLRNNGEGIVRTDTTTVGAADVDDNEILFAWLDEHQDAPVNWAALDRFLGYQRPGAVIEMEPAPIAPPEVYIDQSWSLFGGDLF